MSEQQTKAPKSSANLLIWVFLVLINVGVLAFVLVREGGRGTDEALKEQVEDLKTDTAKALQDAAAALANSQAPRAYFQGAFSPGTFTKPAGPLDLGFPLPLEKALANKLEVTDGALVLAARETYKVDLVVTLKSLAPLDFYVNVEIVLGGTTVTNGFAFFSRANSLAREETVSLTALLSTLGLTDRTLAFKLSIGFLDAQAQAQLVRSSVSVHAL